MRFTHIRFQFNFLSDCSRQRMPIATTYITFIIKYNIIHIDIKWEKRHNSFNRLPSSNVLWKLAF